MCAIGNDITSAATQSSLFCEKQDVHHVQRDEPILMRHRMSLATRENFQEMRGED